MDVSSVTGRVRTAAIVAVAVLGAAAGPALADSSESHSYQVDAAHSGRLWGAGVLPPLHYLGSVALHASNFTSEYPVIANGQAFVVDEGANTVLAIRLSSGAIDWSQALPFSTNPPSFLAYGNGELYVEGDEPQSPGSDTVTEGVEAFNATTGALIRNTHVIGDDPAEPIVANGVLYAPAIGDGGNTAAIRESDGTVLWNVNTGNGPTLFNGGPLTLAGKYLLGFDSCGNGVALPAATGQWRWVWGGTCSGPNGLLGVAAGGYAWFGDPQSGLFWDPGNSANVVLQPASGQIMGYFPGGTSPIFADGVGIQERPVITSQGPQGTTVGYTLAGFVPATNQTLWTFTGTNGSHDLMSLPLAADGYVFVASTNGTLWALNPKTGQVVWSDDPGGSGKVYFPMGLAAGDGYLLVLTTNSVLAFAGSGFPAGLAPASWTQAPSRPAEPLNTAPPSISGQATQGHTLTVVHGSYTDDPTSYDDAWLRCESDGYDCYYIPNATGPTYTLTSDDAGSTIRVVEQGVNAVGTGPATVSAPTAVVQSSGSASPTARTRARRAVPQLSRRNGRLPRRALG